MKLRTTFTLNTKAIGQLYSISCDLCVCHVTCVYVCSLPVEVQRLEHELSIGKDELSQSGVELRAMIRAFKERQLILTSLPQGSDNDSIPAEPTRRIEVWLDDAQWSIMHSDGQLQVRERVGVGTSYY